MSKNTSASLFDCLDETISIMDEISGMQNFERTLHNIVIKLVEKLECKTCAVIQINPRTELLEIVNSYGLSWQFCKSFRNRMIGHVLHDIIWGEQEFTFELSDENSILAQELKLENDFQSCFIIGIFANQGPVGFLHIDSNERMFFNDQRKLIIRLYARLISLLFLKNRLYQDIAQLHEGQTQTGVDNYSYFYSKLAQLLSRAQRLGEQLSVMILDVVRFNSILTTYGVEISDRIMIELSEILHANIRKYDSLSRFGADEFIISIPAASIDQTYNCAEKIQAAVRNFSFTKKGLKIDINIGIANFPNNAKNLSSLITAAKVSLMEAKRSQDKRIYTSPSIKI